MTAIHHAIQRGARKAAEFLMAVILMAGFLMLSGLAGQMTGVGI
jgi:hypothetical protein